MKLYNKLVHRHHIRLNKSNLNSSRVTKYRRRERSKNGRSRQLVGTEIQHNFLRLRNGYRLLKLDGDNSKISRAAATSARLINRTRDRRRTNLKVADSKAG